MSTTSDPGPGNGKGSMHTVHNSGPCTRDRVPQHAMVRRVRSALLLTIARSRAGDAVALLLLSRTATTTTTMRAPPWNLIYFSTGEQEKKKVAVRFLFPSPHLRPRAPRPNDGSGGPLAQKILALLDERGSLSADTKNRRLPPLEATLHLASRLSRGRAPSR